MDLPRIWKTLVCIAASISMVLCTVSMQVAASPAGDGRGPITVVDQGPPIPTDPDAEPDAPYSPGEMMELGITDVTALEPMVLATYPSYTKQSDRQGRRRHVVRHCHAGLFEQVGHR